jgi:hypothetical protein
MHRREQTIYLQLINKKTKLKRIYIYKIENCLVVVGLDL